MGKRSAIDIANAIAYVCENARKIQETLERGAADGSRQFDELLAALRGGADPAGHLETVHHALRRAQDAVGLFGLNRDTSMTTVAGISGDRPREPILLCPRAGQPCSRYAWPNTGDAPECAVTDGPLRRTTLEP